MNRIRSLLSLAVICLISSTATAGTKDLEKNVKQLADAIEAVVSAKTGEWICFGSCEALGASTYLSGKGKTREEAETDLKKDEPLCLQIKGKTAISCQQR